MILQFSMAGYEWVLGLGIMFGLALVMSYLTYRTFVAFFVYMTIFNCFMIWAGLLDLWTLVLNLIILTVILFMQMKSQEVSSQ